MRLPTSLQDQTLLEDEPFKTYFSKQRRLKKALKLTQKLQREILAALEKQSGGAQAVEQWLSLAFEKKELYHDASPTTRSQKSKGRRGKKPFRKIGMCFVRFYWQMFIKRDPVAYLRRIKFEGYAVRNFDQIETKTDQLGPPSPLTEISDSDDDDERQSADIILPNKLLSPGLAFNLSTSMDAARSTPPPEHDSMALSVLADTAESIPQDDCAMPDAASAASESIPVVRTPVRSRIRQGLPARRQQSHASRPSDIELPMRATSRLLTAPADITQRYALERAISPFLSGPDGSNGPMAFLRNGIESKLLTLATDEDIEAPWPENGPEVLRPLRPGTLSLWPTVLPITQEVQMLDHLPTESPIPLVKPPLTHFPPLWAQSRQEICESFEWFRSYQGGVYRNSGTVKGYFLSGFSAQRDCFEFGGKFIVSHGGGKAESTYSHNGHTLHKSADDQRAHDLSVRALTENYRTGQPLVLLIDDKYVHFPFDLGSRDVYMAVLGFYRIIHMWAEYQPSKSHPSGKVVRYKFAFQWCEDQGQPWWFEKDSKAGDCLVTDSTVAMSPMAGDCSMTDSTIAMSPMAPKRIITGPLKPTNIYFQCFTCSDESPRVYAQDWACLNPMCPMFWVAPSGSPLPEQLNYNSEFVSLIDSRPLPRSFRDSLIPKPPVLAPQGGVTTTYACSRGWHCQKCGRLSCRSAWEHYECPNCKDIHRIVGNVRQALPLMSFRVPIANKFVDSQVDPWSGINALPKRIFDHGDVANAKGHCRTFVLPHDRGKIHLIQSNALVHIEADRIFEAYQQQAFDGTLLFRRWPLRTHKLRGPLLTNYFSQNSGETYRYVGGADNTVPFDCAPGAVVQARGLIQKRIREALEEVYEFNEVLSAAYMQQQKMAFHSDSEKGLGPVVAGLSMGSPALMHFRLLSKHAPRDEQRTTAMTVVLRHGDVLVMEGAGVQEFYEHTVIPYNFRIAATARWITPGHS